MNGADSAVTGCAGWTPDSGTCNKGIPRNDAFVAYGVVRNSLIYADYLSGDFRSRSAERLMSIVINGGAIRQSETGRGDPEIRPEGIFYDCDNRIVNFVERAIAAVVADMHYVSILYPLGETGCPEWSDALRHVGFAVTRTRAHRQYVLAVGEGRRLGEVDWLRCIRGHRDVFLAASSAHRTRLETAWAECIAQKTDMWALRSSLGRRVHDDPGSLLDLLGDESVFMGLGGPDGELVVVNLFGVELADVHALLAGIAHTTGVHLFSAGDPTIHRDADRFLDFLASDVWSCVPEYWRRIV